MTLTKKQLKEKAREEKQLVKLNGVKAAGRYRGYIVVVLLLIMLVDILDNFTTNVTGNITSCFINEFFVQGQVFGKSYDYEAGLSLHNTISLIGYVIALLSPFYKALGDKYGRKPLFVISSAGMALGLLIICFCRSYFVFLIGSFITSFFLGHDIQILYILEEAPSEKRATIYSILKGIGGLSSVMIPMLRKALMGDDPSLWRNIYMLPGICGLGVVLLVFFFAKDTQVFIDRRTEYLSEPYEQRLQRREAEKKHGKANGSKAGIGNAIKYIFKHKELKTLILIKILFDAAIIAMTNYESIMFKAGMSTSDITTAEYFFPFIYAASVISSGFLADRIGRKKTVVLFGGICAVSFVLFVVSANSLMKPQLVGALYGLYLGGYWIGRDYMEIISTEMVPTEIRASIIGAEGLLVYIGMGIGFAFVNVGILFMPIWFTCMVFAVPCVAVSVILLFLKVKETMGVNYEDIVDPESAGEA